MRVRVSNSRRNAWRDLGPGRGYLHQYVLERLDIDTQLVLVYIWARRLTELPQVATPAERVA